MTTTTIIGLAGGVLTSIGFIPQIIKGIKTKKMDDVSLWQYLIISVGMCFWLVYGVMLKEIPIILANSFSASCGTFIIILKFKYSNKGNRW